MDQPKPGRNDHPICTKAGELLDVCRLAPPSLIRHTSRPLHVRRHETALGPWNPSEFPVRIFVYQKLRWERKVPLVYTEAKATI